MSQQNFGMMLPFCTQGTLGTVQMTERPYRSKTWGGDIKAAHSRQSTHVPLKLGVVLSQRNACTSCGSSKAERQYPCKNWAGDGKNRACAGKS